VEIAQGDPDTAITDFNSALQIDSTLGAARKNRSWAELRQGAWVSAIVDFFQ
jgi:hypothetical protein